jgi:hypothetical protein
MNIIQQKITADASYENYLNAAKNIPKRAHAFNKTNAQDTLIIPVVVHVIWNTNAEKVSLQQVQSQIRILNEDFLKMSGTNGFNTHPKGANTHIKFALAVRDPQDQPTTGVIYTQTVKTIFDPFNEGELMKFASQGGADAWPRDSYLNLWVCNMAGGILGFASFPGEPANADGVVIEYRAFGDIGSAEAPFDLGRTATHEIGHWLGLFHIWGDDEFEVDNCSFDDAIDDTPLQALPTSGCPSGTRTDACSPNAPGIMYQNYMDYSNDNCMNIFTMDQSDVMTDVMLNERIQLKNSLALIPVGTYVSHTKINDVQVIPNPSNGFISLKTDKYFGELYFELYDLTGKKLIERTMIYDNKMDLSSIESGLYFLRLSDGNNNVSVEKISLIK